ncbi:hypothetical protein I3F58_18325 [Streptomyces sp. MUM 203J]|uniref:hypothetical protein n=1 Tax=Streptomyces sp. MUM 203J TaxID=2791990 RepID=UPI0023D925FF|nr:hypothetical protein [Streptomyces sp. MUM 203J]MCH0541480.1 hypothetical protein [Streptomyces sp. MUM 203J]
MYDHPRLAGRRDLFVRWLEDPTPREEIAERLGVPLGVLLRALNDTAPLQEPLGFHHRDVPFEVVAMDGTCDDIADGRFPMFGAPLTLRCYLKGGSLPQGMYEAADWNFMDAGRPGFVGYLYGVRHGDTLYLAGVQSDLGVRYSYLFQARGDGQTEVRRGDEVRLEPVAWPAEEFGAYVPVLRRTFQRYWIPVLLGAVVAWARRHPEVRRVGLLQFPLKPGEERRGHVVQRVYRELPERVGGARRCVRLDDGCHLYALLTLEQLTGHLGARLRVAAA